MNRSFCNAKKKKKKKIVKKHIIGNWSSGRVCNQSFNKSVKINNTLYQDFLKFPWKVFKAANLNC